MAKVYGEGCMNRPHFYKWVEIETWIGSTPAQLSGKKFKTQTLAGKVMSAVFWNVEGPVCCDYLKEISERPVLKSKNEIARSTLT